MRARSCTFPYHASACRARWAASAARTASDAVANAACTPSPSVFTTCPPCVSTLCRSSASWRASAADIVSRCASQSPVLPSMSVNRNVTVPLGSGGTLERHLEPSPDLRPVMSLPRESRSIGARWRSADKASTQPTRSVLFALGHELRGRLKADLGVGPVAEGLFARGAGAAQRDRGRSDLDQEISVI